MQGMTLVVLLLVGLHGLWRGFFGNTQQHEAHLMGSNKVLIDEQVPVPLSVFFDQNDACIITRYTCDTSVEFKPRFVGKEAAR